MISGHLYIVPTPIGNLQDISLRALQVLAEVDLIACEDTRHSQKLLAHHQISTPLTSYHEHNESQRSAQLISKLQQGQSIALISDAGTPLISDPGYDLVNQCRQAGLKVIALPGACAAITALSAAGLPTDQFRFTGFLPVKDKAKRDFIERLQTESATTVFYEAPRRVLDTVQLIGEILGQDRTLVLAKELSKSFETYINGSAQDIVDWLTQDPAHQKGEFVLMVAGIAKKTEDIPADALTLLTRLQNELPLKKAAAIVAEHYGLKKNQLYQLGLQHSD